MKNTIFYNAGAGSGKTHQLTHILADVIKSHQAKPENVILTTFTDAAAAEFKEKAKNVLYEKQLYDEALGLEQAKIGTVHSVALDFIKKFWYILGHAQDDNVMTEEDTNLLMDSSLANIPTDDELNRLHFIASELNISTTDENRIPRLDFDFWKKQLKDVVECMTSYDISNLDHSKQFSLNYIDSIFTDEVELDANLLDNLLNTLLQVAKDDCAQKPTAKAKERIAAVIKYQHMAQKSLFRAYYQFRSSNFDTKAYQNISDLAKVESIHSSLGASRLVGGYLKECVEIIFNMALRWQEVYKEYKRTHHLIDYNDMEVLFEKLLQNDEVRKDIQTQYTHLFIDEFQDSSPIQVRIFEQLSNLVGQTYAVGDPKQAIYDFRGADTELTLAVIKNIAEGNDGNQLMFLEKSHRSVKAIVDATNDIFIPAFASALKKEQVELKPLRDNIQVSSLRRWLIDGKDAQNNRSSNERKAKQIIQGIQQLVNKENAKYSDIAVLARTNSILKDLEKELRRKGIPVMRKDSSASNSEPLDLLNACLQFAENSHDNYARMRIAFYTRNQSVSELLDAKLCLAEGKEYLDDTELIEKIAQLRPTLKMQSLSAKIETIIVETEFAAYAKACSSSQSVDAELQSIISTAKTYEQHCVQIMEGATIPGWIEYSAKHMDASGDSEGVQLFTIHASKGLAWKYVIIANLETGFSDSIIDRDIFGVKRHKENNETIIHYLQPFASITERLKTNITSTALYAQRLGKKIEEEKRLMYVAMTRAKDVLILASDSDDMKQISETGINMGTILEKFGEAEHLEIIESDISAQSLCMPLIAQSPSAETSRRDIAPSKVQACNCKVSIVASEEKDTRINVGELRHVASDEERYQILGDCVHQALCCVEHLTDAQIQSLIDRWGVNSVLTPQQLRANWNRLMALLQDKYGTSIGCTHEATFRHQTNGQIVSGSIDLIYHLNDKEVVLIDYKTCAAGVKAITDPNHPQYAGKYSGQLATYKAALQASGKEVVASLLYYPISGMLIEVELH